MFGENIEQFINTAFSAAKTEVIFTSSSLLTPKGKDKRSKFDKSMVRCQFNCYCDNSYIGRTTKQLKKRVKEHILGCVDKFHRYFRKKSYLL